MRHDPGTARRRFLLTAGFAACATALPLHAQVDFPRRPIRLVSGFPPGGQGDAMARLFAEKIKAAAGWEMLVDNKPGGALVPATDFVAKSPPDGLVIGLFPQAAYAANQVLFRRVPFDVDRDVTPIAVIGRASIVVAAHPALGVDNLKDLIALSRREEISYGTTGAGTLGHVVLETVNRETGARFKFVSYKGEAQGAQDLMGGHIKLMVLTAAGLRTVLQTNPAIKPIVVTGKRRWPGHENTPTVQEALGAHPAYALAGWQGFIGPAGLPAGIVQALATQIEKAWTLPETQQRLNAVAVLPEYHGPADFARLYQAEGATWAKALTDLGLQGSAG